MNSTINYVQRTFSFVGADGKTVTLTGYNTAGNLWVTSTQNPEEFAANLAKYGIAPSATGKGFVLNMGADVQAAISAGIKISEKASRVPVKDQLSAYKVVNGVYTF